MDQEKEQLEKEKLRQEIKRLKTPFLKQQDLWKPVIIAVAIYMIPIVFGKIKQVYRTNKNYIVRHISSERNSHYSLALYGHNVDPELLSLAKKSLEKDGYTLKNCLLLQGQRPNWLATSPTVLYYDSRTEVAARQVAQKLQRATGKPFKCQAGAGFGVSTKDSKRTLKIHLAL